MEEITIFNIVKHARAALMNNKKLCDIVDNQILAMEGKEGIHYPFITITKQGASETRNKDVVTNYDAIINVTIWHTNYGKLCELEQMVYDTIEDYFMKMRNCPTLSDNYDDVDTEDGCWMGVLQYTFQL